MVSAESESITGVLGQSHHVRGQSILKLKAFCICTTWGLRSWPICPKICYFCITKICRTFRGRGWPLTSRICQRLAENAKFQSKYRRWSTEYEIIVKRWGGTRTPCLCVYVCLDVNVGGTISLDNCSGLDFIGLLRWLCVLFGYCSTVVCMCVCHVYSLINLLTHRDTHAHWLRR